MRPPALLLLTLASCATPEPGQESWEEDDPNVDTGDLDEAGPSGDTGLSGDEVVDPIDNAAIVGAALPTQLDCGAVAQGSVTVRNTGESIWSREDGFKLGAVDDVDELATTTRIWLADDEIVEPGDVHTFTVPFEAGDSELSAHTSWRMVHEGVQWFGETAEATVAVECPETGPPDLDEVIWLHSDISDWPETASLTRVEHTGDELCLDYSHADEWPVYDLDGTEVVGNPWIFIRHDGQWYAGTWEWLRPGQICKAATSVAGDHIKTAPFDASSGWRPTSGETYWFMVSGLARWSERNIEARTDLVALTWP